MLLDNLKVMSRPVSYIEYDIETLDNAEHDVSFYFDISAECCIDDREAEVEFKRTDISLSCGNTAQNVLHKSGDSVVLIGVIYILPIKMQKSLMVKRGVA